MPDQITSVVLSDHQQVAVDAERLSEVANRAAAGEGARGEISITLVSDEAMAELNLKYMGHTGPTDVLSFPIDGKVSSSPRQTPPMIGEVVLCPSYAARENSDLAAELDLLVTHGVLHLLGYDHDTKSKAELMQAAEIRVLGRYGAEAPRPERARSQNPA